MPTISSENFIYKAILISLTVHTIFVCSSYFMKLPELKKAKEKRVEITYRPTVVQKLDISQHTIKPTQQLDLDNNLSSTQKDVIGVKLDKGPQVFKNTSLFERRPTELKSTQQDYIRVEPLTSGNMNNPVFATYQDRVRQSIRERANANFTKLDSGKVYLTFIIAKDGSLKAYQIIDYKTKASQNLKYISTKSLKEAKFPPTPKGMSLPEYTFNIVIEYQVND